MYGYYGGYYPYHMFEGVFMIIFWVFLIVILLRIILRSRGHMGWRGRHGWPGWQGPEHTSASEILKERYAKGEINKEQFEQMKKDIA